MKRYLIYLLVIIVLSFSGWKAYVKFVGSETVELRRKTKATVPVEIVPVKRGDIEDIGVFTGSLEAKSRFLVAPKISGRLEKLVVNIGDRLAKNQLIAVLDDEEANQEMRQAKAALEVARASLEAAKSVMKSVQRELNRIKSLREKNLVSVADLDEASTRYTSSAAQYRVAEAQLDEKQAAFEVVRIRLSYTRIHNLWSVNGAKLVVGERFVDEGSLLSQNTAIVSILDISALVAVIHVTEKDYYKLNIGQLATIIVDAVPGREFYAKVVRVSPLIKEETREAQIELEVPNEDEILKPGLFVRVLIRFGKHLNVTIIPIAALVDRNNAHGVFLADLEAEQARFVKVNTGIRQDERLEILDPPLTGSVVVLGHHLLEDGTAITVPQSESQAGAVSKKENQDKK